MSSAIIFDNLMYWRSGNWVKFDQGITNGSLRIHCDQLIISADNKIVESLNMNGKIKGFYKGDVLILVISGSSSHIRKIKFRVKGNIEFCFETLGRYFPVVRHGSEQNANVFTTKYRNIDEVLKCGLENASKEDNSSQVPEVNTNFVKLCLLDPTFPQLVRETQNILNNF